MSKSLDPRLNRVNIYQYKDSLQPKTSMDQFETYEVFVQVKSSKPYQHEGAVHAPNAEMAFLFGKEQFSRRGTCTGLAIVATHHVMVSPITDDENSVYDAAEMALDTDQINATFEIFHLYKRGKQHVHTLSVQAQDYHDAFQQSANEYNGKKPVLNVWVVKTEDVLFSSEEDQVLWHTLPEKKFRDAIAYKALDKIKKFKEEQIKNW